MLESEYSGITREPPLMPALKADASERTNLLAFLSRLDGVKGPIAADLPPVPKTAIQSLLKPKPEDWTTYHGSLSGNRYAALSQIDTKNVSKLQLQWSYQLPYSPLQTTPLVADGIMYVTAPNQVCSLDARTGREIWCYSRPRNSDGISGDAAKGADRGAAILGGSCFLCDRQRASHLSEPSDGRSDVEAPMHDKSFPYGYTARHSWQAIL